MLVEFQDLVALDIAFDDVLLDDVSFEDSTAFIVEFDDFSLHPTKHYLQASIVPTVIGTDNLTGINAESASIIADIKVVEHLTRLADLPTASVVAVASASGDLIRLKFGEPEAAMVDVAIEDSLTRILDGQRRRVRIRVAGGGKLSLKGPLHSTVIAYTHVSGALNAVTPLESADVEVLTSVAGALTRIVSLEPAGVEIPVSVSGEMLKVKFFEPATDIPSIAIDGTMVRTRFMTPQAAIARVAVTSRLKIYQAIRGDDDLTLYGDDDEQLGDTF